MIFKRKPPTSEQDNELVAKADIPGHAWTRKELAAMDRRFRRAMEPPSAEEYAQLRAMAEAGEIPRRVIRVSEPDKSREASD